MRKFGIARLLCLAILIGLAVFRVADPHLVEELRVRTFDTFQLIDPRVKTERPVTIVDIDEESLARFGQWPWPRTRLADLVDRLTGPVPSAIAFDIVFAEPDRSSGVSADSIGGLDEPTRAKLRSLPNNDEVRAERITRSRVVLGPTGCPTALPIRKSRLSPPSRCVGEDPRPFLIHFPGLFRNVAPLEKAAAGRGLFTIKTELDGLVRRVPMIAGGGPTAALTCGRAARRFRRRHHRHNANQAGIQGVDRRGRPDPNRPERTDLGPFRAPHPSSMFRRPMCSKAAFLRKVAGKLVLIGTSAVGLLDVKTDADRSRCPASKFMPRCWRAC